MKLVTTTHALDMRFGLKESIKRIKEYGFDAYDCTLYEAMKPGRPLALTAWREYAKEIRKYADDIGIPCTQTHSVLPPFSNEAELACAAEAHKRAMEVSAILGAEITVIHPSSWFNARANYERLYSKLIPLAKELGIKIATENMFRRNPMDKSVTSPASCGTPREFAEMIDLANDDCFVGCLDIGHTYLTESVNAPDFIKALGGKRIKAIHFHSNNGISDMHTIPHYGTVDTESVCRELAKIGYDGNLTLEADKFIMKYPRELLAPAYKLLRESAKYLADRIEYYKTEEEK